MVNCDKLEPGCTFIIIMHFDEFFRLGMHINSKMLKLRQSLLRQHFSPYALYRDMQSQSPSQKPTSASIYFYIYPKQNTAERQSLEYIDQIFGVEPNHEIHLLHVLRLLNGDEAYQLSMYSDCPVSSRVRRKVSLLIRLEVLFAETLHKFRHYLRGRAGGQDMVVQSFHAIDADRNYFVNAHKYTHIQFSLKRFIGGEYTEQEVTDIVMKLWRVPAVPFLDYFQLFTKNTPEKAADKRSNSKKTTATHIASRVKSEDKRPQDRTARTRGSHSTAKRCSSTHQHFVKTQH